MIDENVLKALNAKRELVEGGKAAVAATVAVDQELLIANQLAGTNSKKSKRPSAAAGGSSGSGGGGAPRAVARRGAPGSFGPGGGAADLVKRDKALSLRGAPKSGRGSEGMRRSNSSSASPRAVDSARRRPGAGEKLPQINSARA